MGRRKRLGDILLGQGLLTEKQLAAALEMQLQSGEKLGEAIIKLGYVSAGKVADALSEHLRIPRVDFSKLYIPPEVINLVSETMIVDRNILPIKLKNGILSVAMVDPLNITVIDELQDLTGYAVSPLIATAEEIEAAFQRTRNIAQTAQEVFKLYQEEEDEKVEDDDHLGDAPGVKLANMILEQAIKQKASDVHLEPHEEGMRVRIRIDGIL
ncbi:MAG TPA: type II secretion system protein GspE, partial [Firmicutes bacterium]|nr:type II secretion system protein GspE [Bacillota bacterium]